MLIGNIYQPCPNAATEHDEILFGAKSIKERIRNLFAAMS